MSLALPAHIQEEVDYAANLFVRADKALSDELKALAAAGVQLDPLLRLTFEASLSAITGALRLLDLQAKEAKRGA